MKRVFAIAACSVCLLSAAAADARVRELGSNAPAATPSCPTDCQAITRTSAYQVRVGDLRKLYRIPHKGHIVAWTITLGDPAPDQISFFQDVAPGSLGLGPPEARISVVRPGKRNKRGLPHRLLAQSPVERLNRYFGSSPSFVLDEPIPVRAGNYVALTVPTWAPALAVGLGQDNAWLSSRRKGDCDNVSQRAATEAIGGIRHYGCTYRTARLMYTVTYVPEPRPTDGSDRRR